MRTLAKLATLAAVAITGIWLLLNLVYAIKYIWDIDLFGMAHLAPYISRVDISAANTIIFFLTALYVDRGTRRYAAVKEGRLSAKDIWTPTFPFTAGFKTLLIQLGLLGTIFAFIVAFNRLASGSPKSQHSYDPAVLIVPLGAALWSSFAGIGFAYIVVPPIQKLFARMLRVRAATPDSSAEVHGLSDSLSAFRRETVNTTAALKQMRDHATSINDTLDGLSKSELQTIASEIASNTGSLAKTTQQIVECHSGLAIGISGVNGVVEALRIELQNARADGVTLARALNRQSAAADRGCGALEGVEQEVRANTNATLELSRRIGEYDSRIAESLYIATSLERELINLTSVVRELTVAVGAGAPIQRGEQAGSLASASSRVTRLIGELWRKNHNNGKSI